MSHPTDPRDPRDQTSFAFPPEPRESAPNPGVRLDVDERNIGWIVFDLPGESVNKLTTGVMETLRGLIDQAVRRNVLGLAFVSDKPGMFIAGADVEEIAGVTDPEEGREKAAYGQSVFEAVARFPRPTAAVINGPCLGGGYELSLACRWRIAEDDPAVRVGLPEVKLGILPGFGGTQRLPRLVGLPKALDLILAGKTLPAKPAYRRGMVDALVPAGLGRRIAAEVLAGERRLRRREIPRVDRALAALPFLRRRVLDKARTTLRKKARPEHYPSPFLALDAVAAGYDRSEVEAYGVEARLLGQAIVTDTSKSLVWLFRNQNLSRKPPELDLGLAQKPKRLAVLGAGVMGGGIAYVCAEKKLPIRVKDIQPAALEGALRTAGGLWGKAVRRRRLTPAERDRRLEQLSFTLDYRGFRTVDFVFEAVVENLEIKRAVLAEAERAVPDDAVIASNTSSLRIGDISADARRPGRVVGLHFFNPVDRMPLVEVVAGPRSEPWAVATAYRLALDLGKTPILVQDVPGFLVNRLLSFYLGEALALHEEGAGIDMVDRVLTDFGMPMGPFALLDRIGLDVADKVTRVVKDAYGDRLPASTAVARLAEQGHLGHKSGQGFYRYRDGKPAGVAPGLERPAGGKSATPEQALDRLLLPMVNEAARCLEEGAVGRPLDVDLGMVFGTGFPPFRGGLLRWADAVGVGTVVEKLETLARTDARFAPDPALVQRADGFYAARDGS